MINDQNNIYVPFFFLFKCIEQNQLRNKFSDAFFLSDVLITQTSSIGREKRYARDLICQPTV